MLKISNLNFGYDKEKVLNDFSLEIKPEEIVALKGKSGSGKSTVLRLIAGLEKPSSGSVHIEGVEMSNIDTYKRNVGYVFQDFALFPHLTIYKNIRFGISHLNVKEQKRLISEYADLFEISNLLKRYPHEISGGQKQRVAIARSLITKPKLLLLDEPMSALDVELKKTLRPFLRKVLKELEITAIVVTHDENDALEICDRMIEM